MNRFVKYLLWTLGGIVLSVVAAIVQYSLFALVIDTDVEKALKEDNRLYQTYLPGVRNTAVLMETELEFLRMRDGNIYRQVFKADAPSVSRMLEGDGIFESGEIDGDVVKNAHRHSGQAAEIAGGVEDMWREILDSLQRKNFEAPPMIFPIKGMNHKSLGASVGDKLSPFYKLAVFHDGLDIIAPAQTAVCATADGRVTGVRRSSGGKGNMVEITHRGGYVTRYAHLSAVKVERGKIVRAGEKIGEVGDSGRSFTTHLHYEVCKDGKPMDPNNYFFGSVMPEEYLRILIKSASSGQSMD